MKLKFLSPHHHLSPFRKYFRFALNHSWTDAGWKPAFQLIPRFCAFSRKSIDYGINRSAGILRTYNRSAFILPAYNFVLLPFTCGLRELFLIQYWKEFDMNR